MPTHPSHLAKRLSHIHFENAALNQPILQTLGMDRPAFARSPVSVA
jgi:hypothetical protein